MKIQFHALTKYESPGIHIWDKGNNNSPLKYLLPVAGPDNSWWRFEIDLPENTSIGFKLFEWNEGKSKPQTWESANEDFNRTIMLKPGETLPQVIWMIQESNRVLLQDPLVQTAPRVRIHLITKEAFREGKIFAWVPGKASFVKDLKDTDQYGTYVDLDLDIAWQTAFNFKFITKDGEYEPDYVNRTWASPDGKEIWTHSKAAAVLSAAPDLEQLTVHFRHEWGNVPLKMHLWQESSDYQDDFNGTLDSDGWITYQTDKKLYTGLPYGFMFYIGDNWEAEGARRFVSLSRDEEYWALEGSSHLFTVCPERNRQVQVEIVGVSPGFSSFAAPDGLEVRIDHAKTSLPSQFQQQPDGTWLFWTYSEVATSFRFCANQQCEASEHLLIAEPNNLKAYVVLGRPHCLFERPPQPLVADPPYTINQQGVVEEAGFLRFTVHAPYTRVRLKGQWQQSGLVDLKCTTDGKYWWIKIPVADIVAGLPNEFQTNYHGATYCYIMNDDAGGQANANLNGFKAIQDPAAGWVETTYTRGNSKLVNRGNYGWKSNSWKTPGWNYLSIYELHPARFTDRNQLRDSFAEVAREIEAGYLKDLGITALLLMPVNEFTGVGWGYNPSYYYATKSAYGGQNCGPEGRPNCGPDELKKLVDTCHQHGIAVLIDVVFNHAGNSDNILWDMDITTYFDGKTKWGGMPMPNFDNDITKDFFADCLVYWNREYRIDGFRFDFTDVIINGHKKEEDQVQEPGSGGGWEFLNYLRQKLKNNDPNCLMMAEQYPNNLGLTNYGGPMDTQWCDDFHDRLVDVCRGSYGEMSRYADALKYTQTLCQQWYNFTNFPTNHDEVGNVDDRIAMLPGWGRGLRVNKVAAAATLMSRGIPMFFMGEEVAEFKQFFQNTTDTLDLDNYEADVNRSHVRSWWQTLLKLRKDNPRIQGESPIDVHYVDGPVIAFSRGMYYDYFVVLNFGDQERSQNLGIMNLPDGTYKELLNSTYPAFQAEFENEYRNWGEVHRDSFIQIPDNGVVILEKVQ